MFSVYMSVLFRELIAGVALIYFKAICQCVDNSLYWRSSIPETVTRNRSRRLVLIVSLPLSIRYTRLLSVTCDSDKNLKILIDVI